MIDTVLDPLLTVFGESLPTTASLFATPTICVVSEAWIPAIVELSALTANWHTPGVLVTLTAKSTRPWLATIPTDPTPPIEQMPALDDARVTEIVVRLSLIARKPLASFRSTRKVESVAGSAATGFTRNAADSWVAAPGTMAATTSLQPVSPKLVAVTCIPPERRPAISFTLAAPALGVCGPDGNTESSAGVTFVKVIAGVVAFATRLPLLSLKVAVTVVVDVPSAGRVVAPAEQTRLTGTPNTVIAAEAIIPADVATTLHGWLCELVAVAAKRPVGVIAPQPPVTVQALVTVEVNWS